MATSKRKKVEDAIITLISERGPGKTICPSEAARHVFADDEWRDEMDFVRQVAQHLIEKEVIRATQKGKVVKNVLEAHGPIRLSRAKN